MGKTVGQACSTPTREGAVAIATTSEGSRQAPPVFDASKSKIGDYTSDVQALRDSDASDAEIAAYCDLLADKFVDHHLDRWRNKAGGYNKLLNSIGLGEGKDAISDFIGNDFDKSSEFRQWTRSQSSHHVQGLVHSNQKITPAFLSEHISHGANHSYKLMMSDVCDREPKRAVKAIFGKDCDFGEDQLDRFRQVTSVASERARKIDKMREADGARKRETDFWFMVNKAKQEGKISNREDLAEFTLDQMNRYPTELTTRPPASPPTALSPLVDLVL